MDVKLSDPIGISAEVLRLLDVPDGPKHVFYGALVDEVVQELGISLEDHASTKQPVFEAPRLIKRSEPHIINPQEPEQREIRAIRRGRTSENASSLLNEESPPGHSQIKQDATSILDGDIEEELSSLLFEQGMQDLANGKNTFSPALNVNGGSDYTSPPTRPPQPHD